MNYYHVAVQAPIRRSLVYQSETALSPGLFVEVKLGSRKVKGLILSSAEKPYSFQAKNILRAIPDAPILDSARVKWLKWLAQYYFYPAGVAALSCFPPPPPKAGVKTSASENLDRPQSTVLESSQKQIVQSIQKIKNFKTHLLYGVTGSGKTEVYLQLIEDQIKKGKSSLVLVPEISLTPQLFFRFEKRFPGLVGMIHSGIRSRKRYMEWQALTQGKKKILLGARSALFCPLPSLSLIIVDEEHETHFKQDDKLKYHARDTAIMLAQFYDIPVILGSATPSLETWFQAQSGKYKLHTLKNRFQNRPLPEMAVVDLKKENKDLPFWLSPYLFDSLKETLKKKEQAALFLNRRGQAPVSLCVSCGQNQKCANCDISLVLHFDQFLVCHYCGYSIEFERALCAVCGCNEIQSFGVGTQAVYSEIKKLFPSAVVALADSDHVHTPKQFKTLVENMEKGNVDVLIGTQMISKGLDFKHLNLVGLVLADVSLFAQDFRSAERTFQVITQMAGRAGRHSAKAGRAVIQTYNPSHHIIQSAAKMDFEGMARKELEFRKNLKYPPYVRLALVQISAVDKASAASAASYLANQIRQKAQNIQKEEGFKCLGPAPAPVSKLKSKSRFHILIKAKSSGVLQNMCSYIAELKKTSPSVQIQINKDPVFF